MPIFGQRKDVKTYEILRTAEIVDHNVKMAPVIIPAAASQSRTIVISPSMFTGDENRKVFDGGELPKYAVGLFESSGPGPRKRKRLTHLTPEEKVMRRKLKNRVAAQTARDRKKARLETLEDAVSKIQEQTKKLLDVNSQLLERAEELEKENQILRKRLGLDNNKSFIEEKREELSIIKKEFDQIETFQNRVKSESSDDEGFCVLTSCEGNDVTDDVRSLTDASSLEATKCVSPVPAAFGERVKEGPIPQQQEAVNPAKLIHLRAESEESSRLQTPTLTMWNQQKMTQTSVPSSKHWRRLILSNITLPTSVKKEMPLDLRKQ